MPGLTCTSEARYSHNNDLWERMRSYGQEFAEDAALARLTAPEAMMRLTHRSSTVSSATASATQQQTPD